MKLKDLLTKDELKEVSKQNRELLEQARARGIKPTDEQKRELWQTLVSKKIATKKVTT